MSNATDIQTIKDQAIANMLEITAHPKPSYSVDGHSWSWTEYMAQLQSTIQWCNSQLTAETPFEVVSQAYT